MTNKNPDTAFEDPLENYDPPQFDDPVERALHEQRASAIPSKPFAAVSADTPTAVALEKLVGKHIACLLVEDGGRLAGVFSDRDVLEKVALEYDRVKDLPVREVMTVDPVHVHEDDAAAAVFSVMAVSGYRHVPVVDSDHAVVGIVSPQRATSFLQKHFAG